MRLPSVCSAQWRPQAEVLLGPQGDPAASLQEHGRRHQEAPHGGRPHQLRLPAISLRQHHGGHAVPPGRESVLAPCWNLAVGLHQPDHQPLRP